MEANMQTDQPNSQSTEAIASRASERRQHSKEFKAEAVRLVQD